MSLAIDMEWCKNTSYYSKQKSCSPKVSSWKSVWLIRVNRCTWLQEMNSPQWYLALWWPGLSKCLYPGARQAGYSVQDLLVYIISISQRKSFDSYMKNTDIQLGDESWLFQRKLIHKLTNQASQGKSLIRHKIVVMNMEMRWWSWFKIKGEEKEE